MSTPANFPDVENTALYFTLLNSKTRPLEFGKIDYDIHVYFNSLEERETALAFREAMRQAFESKHVYFGELINIPVGPHSVPQWEGNFQKDLLPEIFLWVIANRGNLNILLHPFSGDVVWDHTTGGVFFGHTAASNVNVDFLNKMIKK